ncbi:MAG: hypothetical protein JKY31_09380 [Rhodobacteraceae bacterium]|nr:hypothetical protein [Paracoccaceae bacterium]
MELIADGLLIAGALAAAFYCYVLSRKIKGLSRLDTGLGGAISALSVQVDEMQVSVKAAAKASGASMKDLVEITNRAEIAAGRLELLMVAVHERGMAPKQVNISEVRGKKIKPESDAIADMQEPLLSAIEVEENASTRVDLLNALQKVMAVVKK